jgi:hypothetical protein
VNEFENGVWSMACNCRSALRLVESGTWTRERMEQWLEACMNHNPEEILKAQHEIQTHREKSSG